MAGKTILVLGGGVGGLVAANELRKQLGREHRIVLIDKEAQHVFSPSFLWLIFGWREPSQIAKDLSLLNKKGIEYFNTEVVKIDPENKVVETSAQQKLVYDYLVIALGAELAPETIPGFSEAYNLHELAGVTKARDALREFSGGKVVVLVSSMPFKCPAAPYEIALLIDYFFKAKGARSLIDLQIFTPELLPMATAGPEVGNALKQMVEGREIGFNPNHKVVSIDPLKKEVVFENGSKAKFAFLIGIPPHRCPQVAKEAGLTNEAGWIPVERNTLKTKYDNIYALGDITTIKLPGQYKPEVPLMLPKAGVFAHAEAEVVAYNIAAEINGVSSRKEFDGRGSCFLEIGYGKAGYAKGNFFARPQPVVNMRPPGRIWHWNKVLLEKYWLWRWF